MISGYLVENGHVGIKRCRHGVFMFNRNDLFISRSLDIYGEWGESEISLLRNILRPGGLVVDVGANIGTHTVAFSNIVGSTGVVLAFEPQRLAFQLLCGNVAVNCLTNVQCFQQAVGASMGNATIPALSPHEPDNFGLVAIGNAPASEAVSMVAIDTLRLNSCDLIKVDVEGMEADVIRGARQTIATHRPVLFVENHSTEGASGTIAALLEAGYKLWWHIADYYNVYNFFGNRDNVFAQCQPEANLLCLPKERELRLPGLIECTGAGDNWKIARERAQAAVGKKPRPASRLRAKMSVAAGALDRLTQTPT